MKSVQFLGLSKTGRLAALRESDSEQTLKAVCDCNGSIRFVHFKCLCDYKQLTKEEICNVYDKWFDVKYLK